MNAQIEGANKPPQKKRGPKPKVAAIPIEMPDNEGVSVGEDKSERIALMNKRLQMQWEGQSPNLTISDRAMRLRMAMKQHGWLDLVDHVDINEERNRAVNNPSRRSVKDYL